MHPMATEGMRRRPTQQRSLERVERIASATASLIDEVGYEATTTTLIAQRAEVPIGTLYQFFPDKRSIVLALSLRNVELLRSEIDAALRAPFDRWQDAVAAGLERFIDLYRSDRAFRVVLFGDFLDSQLIEPGRNNDSVVADQLVAMLVVRFGARDDAELRLAMIMTLTTAEALVRLAFLLDEAGNDAVLDEARAIVPLHLERHLRTTS